MNNYLQINNIEIQNFLSFTGPIKFDFNQHYGVVLIHGENKNISTNNDENDTIRNGCGKTALVVDALLFGFFGRTEKNIKKENVPNRSNPKKCKVAVDFNINEHHYVIENGINPTYCKLFKEDEEITKSSAKETREYIEREVVKSSYLIFKNTQFLSSTDANDMFYLTAADKRQFLEQLFDLSMYGKLWRMAKDDTNRMQKEVDQKYTKIDEYESYMKDLKEKEKNFESDKKKKIKQIDSGIEEIKQEYEKIQNVNEEISKEENEISKANFEIKKLEKTINDYSDKATKIDNKLSSLETECRGLESGLKKYSDVLDVLCKDCYGKVDDMLNLTENGNKLEENKENIYKLKDHKNKIVNEKEKLEKKVDELDNDGNESSKRLEKFKKTKERKTELENKIKELENRKEEIQSQESQFQELINKYQSELKQLNNNVKDEEHELKHIKFLVYFFGDDAIKKHLINTFIGKLNEQIQYYLNYLGAEYSIWADSQFDFSFHTNTGIAQFENFSSGERRRIVIATTFAIKDLLEMRGRLKSNVLSFDEILDANIDNYAYQRVVELIKQKNKESTCFVTTHRDSIVDDIDFDGIIKIEKFGDSSQIVEDTQIENK